MPPPKTSGAATAGHPQEQHIHVHVHIPGWVDHTAQLTRMETIMTTAAEQLTELQAQLADTTADVLAKLDQLTAQLGELTPEAQATLDEIRAGVSALDATVGDADGSDTVGGGAGEQPA